MALPKAIRKRLPSSPKKAAAALFAIAAIETCWAGVNYHYGKMHHNPVAYGIAISTITFGVSKYALGAVGAVALAIRMKRRNKNSPPTP